MAIFEPKSWAWISTPKFTCRVEFNRAGTISKDSAPILKRFYGKKWVELWHWVRPMPGFEHKFFDDGYW